MNNVISTKVKIFRNVKDYKFVPKLEQNKQTEIVNMVSQALNGKMSLINLSTVDEKVINSLKTAGLIENANTQNLFVNEKTNTSISLFDGEHITIISTGMGYDKNTFNSAREISNILSNKINLSYNDTYGYLMSNLSNIGAGLKIECLIDLNAINELGKIEQVKQNLKKLGYALRPTQEKNIFVLSTVCNLGFSENEIFEEFDKMIAKLQDLEVESAKMLDAANHEEILDATMRSLAILKSAYILSYEELKTHLSKLRTAANLNMINLSQQTLNKLQNLTCKNGEFVAKSELINLAKQTQEILKGEKDV